MAESLLNQRDSGTPKKLNTLSEPLTSFGPVMGFVFRV